MKAFHAATATTGHFSPARTAGSIVYSTAAGAAIGLAAGWVGRRLRDRVNDPPIEIAGSILLAYVAYLPAAAIHASGVLAAVTAGLEWVADIDSPWPSAPSPPPSCATAPIPRHRPAIPALPLGAFPGGAGLPAARAGQQHPDGLST